MAEMNTEGGARAANDRHRRVRVVIVGHFYVWYSDSRDLVNLQHGHIYEGSVHSVLAGQRECSAQLSNGISAGIGISS